MTGRGNWTSWFEFFFSCLGYMVGLGNIWRFPYICYKNGGGAFVIVFSICLVLIALPIIFVELSIAQFSSLATMKIWQCCPLFQGIGYAMMFVAALMSVYYNVIVSWTLYYFIMSFTSVLPWSSCDNEWNTLACRHRDAANITGTYNTTSLNNTSMSSTISGHVIGNISISDGLEYNTSQGVLPKTPSEEFWEHNVLNMTDGIHNIGGLQWRLTLCLFAAWVFVFLSMIRGIQSSGKVMSVLASIPYLLLLILLIRGLTLPGSLSGIRYFMIPQWQKLLDYTVWADAANQAYFSAIGPGVAMTYASFNRFNNNCYRDAIILPIADGLTSLFAGFVIFSSLGYMAVISNTSIDEVVKQGPGIAFMVYPEALSTLPLPQIWSVLFFLTLFIVGLNTQITLVQTIVLNYFDFYPHMRGRQILVSLLICSSFFTFGIILTSQGGVYILHLIDYYLPALCGLLLGFLEITVISWIYGSATLLNDIEQMIGYKPAKFWRILWMIIAPLTTLVIWMINVGKITPVTYGKTVYPQWALGIGWVTASISMVLLPIGMAKTLWNIPGSFLQRIRKSLKPTKEWRSASPDTEETESSSMTCRYTDDD